MIKQQSFNEFKAKIDGKSPAIVKNIMLREKAALSKESDVENPESQRILDFCNYFLQQEEFVGLPNNLSLEDKQFYKNYMKKLQMPQYMLVDFEEANV